MLRLISCLGTWSGGGSLSYTEITSFSKATQTLNLCHFTSIYVGGVHDRAPIDSYTKADLAAPTIIARSLAAAWRHFFRPLLSAEMPARLRRVPDLASMSSSLKSCFGSLTVTRALRRPEVGGCRSMTPAERTRPTGETDKGGRDTRRTNETRLHRPPPSAAPLKRLATNGHTTPRTCKRPSRKQLISSRRTRWRINTGATGPRESRAPEIQGPQIKNICYAYLFDKPQ